MYKWNPERAPELIEREHITQFVGVPTMSWDLLESPDFASRDTSSLAAVGGGGAPRPTGAGPARRGGLQPGRPQIGYGLTETNAYGPATPATTTCASPTARDAASRSWRSGSWATTASPWPPARWARSASGAHVIRGYWNRPEATAEAIVDGWLRTGDLGRLDDEGFIYVEDRAKDMVIRGGENIYCAEVEAAI